MFWKNPQISNYIKISPAGSEFFHADRQTDRQTDKQTDKQTDTTKVIVIFRNFAKAPESY